jgi:hypothetical protein
MRTGGGNGWRGNWRRGWRGLSKVHHQRARRCEELFESGKVIHPLISKMRGKEIEPYFVFSLLDRNMERFVY